MGGNGVSGLDGPDGAGRSDNGPAPVVTRKIAAEAATWIARLHGPSRSPAMEQGLREWLSRSAAHRHAFERCTDVWEEVAGVSAADVYAGVAARSLKAALAGERWWARIRWPLAAMLVVLVGAAAFGAHRWWAGEVYSTGIGDQQQVLLEDGTRMSLNTDTRVRVEIDADQRSVNVAGGEAMFEVAKDPHRPFLVRVAGTEVRAVGTVFAVRMAGRSADRRDGPVTVTLLEGQISVRPTDGDAGQAKASAKPVMMQAGDRMLLVGKGRTNAPAMEHLDRQHLERLVAWKRGEVVFDNLSLPEAVAEVNRYTRKQIVLVGDMSSLHVSGLFQTSDSTGFAHAVAALHGLTVREQAGRLELAGPQ